MRNLQEQVKKAFCYQKLFWSFTVWINCSSDLKNFANSRPSASNFKFFSRSLEQFFLTVGQNNFGNKIPLLRPRKQIFLHQYFYPNFNIYLPSIRLVLPWSPTIKLGGAGTVSSSPPKVDVFFLSKWAILCKASPCRLSPFCSLAELTWNLGLSYHIYIYSFLFLTASLSLWSKK